MVDEPCVRRDEAEGGVVMIEIRHPDTTTISIRAPRALSEYIAQTVSAEKYNNIQIITASSRRGFFFWLTYKQTPPRERPSLWLLVKDGLKRLLLFVFRRASRT